MPKKRQTITGLVNKAATFLQKIVRLKAAVKTGGVIQCVTCGVWKDWRDMQGGHFIKRQHKKWTLVEENIHPQCPRCNQFLGGNDSAYALYMIDTYGRDFVDEMIATKTEPRKYTRVELEELIKELRQQARELEGQVA